MGLTEEQAVNISIELWKRMAKTGSDDKGSWKGWAKYGYMLLDCPLCEYSTYCEIDCPYHLKFGGCMKFGSPFERWIHCRSTADRKTHAKAFLKQLYQLKEELCASKLR